jgi:hypothetical protein
MSDDERAQIAQHLRRKARKRRDDGAVATALYEAADEIMRGEHVKEKEQHGTHG